MLRIGILSDTHLYRPSEIFYRKIKSCFAETPIILHAGDLTDISILDVFKGKEIHAVHGNMCSTSSRNVLPRKKIIKVEGFTIGLIHNTGRSYDFEDFLLDEFESADCIVYGHTHHAVCHRIGSTLYINPGSFMSTGRYGAPGTYAILEVGTTLHCDIHEVPE